MMTTDFEITADNVVSQAFRDRNINSFQEAIHFVSHLPYGRNADKTKFVTVLADGRGTCSTKHALLLSLARENDVPRVSLFIGIFRMNAINTPLVTHTLHTYALDYIPEAHCYLKINGEILDVTNGIANGDSFLPDLLEEQEIVPEQIGEFKISYHKDYLAKWLRENPAIPYSLKELWDIREQCIRDLAGKPYIQIATTLTPAQFGQINTLWNEEYPEKLKDRFALLLEGVDNYTHYMISDNENRLAAWAVLFHKEEPRFCIIVSRHHQGSGLGRQLITRLQQEQSELYGWMIDHNNDRKADGSTYHAPVSFYLKLGFRVYHDVRIDNELVSAVRIGWRRE